MGILASAVAAATAGRHLSGFATVVTVVVAAVASWYRHSLAQGPGAGRSGDSAGCRFQPSPRHMGCGGRHRRARHIGAPQRLIR